jgi:hypothetical protein
LKPFHDTAAFGRPLLFAAVSNLAAESALKRQQHSSGASARVDPLAGVDSAGVFRRRPDRDQQSGDCPRGLQRRLTWIYRERRDKTLFIAGDGRLPYKKIIAVMDSAKSAGVKRLGVVTPAMRRAQNK